ncbi:MAG: YdcF family protein [Candidatus Margulisiibacteriota bacterium]
MKKRLFWFSILIIIVVGICFTYPYILEGAARFLVVRDKIEPADIIVVLSGAPDGERVDQAVSLFKDGYADKLLMSGGPLAWRLTAAEWMRKQAVAQGVPSPAILLEDRSESTRDNALFSLPIIKKNNIASLIIVTSPNHSRRAKWVFKKVFAKEKIKILSYPVEKSKFQIDRWWTRHEDTQTVMSEYFSLAYYFLKGY